mgnify:CR=1 FL=1
MTHVNRFAVGGIVMTMGFVIFTYVPNDWLMMLAAVMALISTAYVVGYVILRSKGK